MNTMDRDQLIERYMNGAMGGSEEQEFLRRLQGDRDLSRLLEAERIVKGAMAADSVRLAMPDAASQARFMAMLDLTSAPVNAPRVPVAAAGNGRRRRAIVIPGLLALLAIGVTTYYFASSPNLPRRDAAVPAAVRHPAAVIAPPPASNTATIRTEAPANDANPVPAPVNREIIRLRPRSTENLRKFATTPAPPARTPLVDKVTKRTDEPKPKDEPPPTFVDPNVHATVEVGRSR